VQPISELFPTNTVTVLAEMSEIVEQARAYWDRVRDGGGVYGPPATLSALAKRLLSASPSAASWLPPSTTQPSSPTRRRSRRTRAVSSPMIRPRRPRATAPTSRLSRAPTSAAPSSW
jgi:hypothetical protein